jgi:hypothetical protein
MLAKPQLNAGASLCAERRTFVESDQIKVMIHAPI